GVRVAWAIVATPRVDPRMAAIAKPEEVIGPLRNVERSVYDWEMRQLRGRYPRPLENDVVIIGIDEQTEQAFPEPVALWHRHAADVYAALAKAKPLAVGVDIVLPERSFE